MRVASVPTAHPYVASLHHPEVVRLPDPPVPGAPQGVWWPSPWLDADHLRAHAADVDLLHVHFGFDDRTPDQLRALVAALADTGIPLVLTVHDLRNPHHADPAPHTAALDVLVPAAAGLVTLTRGAAARIRERWGRDALVLGHPAVVGPEWLGRPRPLVRRATGSSSACTPRATAPTPTRSGWPARSPRPPRAGSGSGSTRTTTTGVARSRTPCATSRVSTCGCTPPFDDDAFHGYLQELDLSVLPYRWGTHSGWLEACHDLGTTALVPDVGHFREQAPCLTYALAGDGPDRASLAAAVALAHRTRPVWRADPADRRRRRAEVADAHAREYRRVLAGVPA
ncbi:glycosyltransferase [Pseudonocardia sp. ICBG1293]|uniref:glycosyltransferase n=1 Tax=Pseudonocardia sp. ICBG1293 TaxID=2844382 RepID=UPI001CCEFB7C|nr:glycosyltransferase [Pseudonocardia sp. ICBG1293]